MVGASLQNTVHLGIETTGRFGSIAVLLGQRLLRQSNLDPKSRSAATLAPALRETLLWCDQSDHRPQFLSVADGPGSFTGLRIGVTTAKTLSYALELPLVSVDSLAAIAAASFSKNLMVQSLWVAIDAYRGQVFTGTFSREQLLPPVESVPEDWTAHPSSVRVLDRAQWGERIADLPVGTKLAGDGKLLGETVEDRVERECDAVGVALLAIRAAATGGFIDPLGLVPRYLKASAAEETAARRSSRQ